MPTLLRLCARWISVQVLQMLQRHMRLETPFPVGLVVAVLATELRFHTTFEPLVFSETTFELVGLVASDADELPIRGPWGAWNQSIGQ